MGGTTLDQKQTREREVRDTVESILAEVASRGDAAVRELSVRFDGWDREIYRLSEAEITHCLNSLAPQEREDIAFAQTPGPALRRDPESVDGGRRDTSFAGVVLGIGMWRC